MNIRQTNITGIEHTYDLNHIDATAQWLLTQIEGHKVIALHGNMGVGKTTIVNAICSLLGVADTTSSPTFSIINEYRYTSGDSKKRSVFHIDLYRLRSEQEAIQAGVEDCIYSGEYCFVEWPEKAPGLFPPETIHITLTQKGDQSRSIKIDQE